VYPARFHVVLSLAGRDVAHGWWASEETARGRFRAWVGDYGRPGARVTLTDEETGEALTEWPDRE
jgi:hypothetical protein